MSSILSKFEALVAERDAWKERAEHAEAEVARMREGVRDLVDKTNKWKAQNYANVR